MSTGASVRRSATRSRVARCVAAVSALFWAVFFFGVIDLLVPVLQTPGFYAAYLLETGWGVLYTFFVAVPLLALSIVPRSPGLVFQLAAVAACLAVTAVAAGSWAQLAPAAALAATCWGLAALTFGSREHVRPRRTGIPSRLDAPVAAAATLLVGPALVFAGRMIVAFREGHPPTDDDTWGIDHWPTQAALALAAAALAFGVAAGVRARRPGTVISAGTLTVGSIWFGSWSVVYPDHAGSAGGPWGVALIVWAPAFAVLTAWRLRVARRPAKSLHHGSRVPG